MSETIPTEMRSTYAVEYGTPASKHLKQGPLKVPTVAADHVLIRVHAASINPIDYKLVNGVMKRVVMAEFPMKIGYDAAGTIVSVGSAVDQFKVGDEVYTRVDRSSVGTFSEFVAPAAAAVALKPKSLTFSEAAAVPLAALTAYQALTSRIQLQSGQRILITAGGSAVGGAAIQIAAIIGAKDIATTCSARSADKCRKLGATIIVDRNAKKFWDELRDFDAVFDTTDETAHAFTVLRKGGICISIAGVPTVTSLERSGVTVPFAAKLFLGTVTAPTTIQAKAMNVRWEHMFMSPSGKDLSQLTDWIEQKRFSMPIDKTFPFDKAIEAIDYVESGNQNGKVVITI